MRGDQREECHSAVHPSRGRSFRHRGAPHLQRGIRSDRATLR
ncbi:hypothetical protein FM125_04515 [Micrococcus lylae]|uniref:Uncharacterized protein n=1 Tax=Micrococcus lylae TaxID=1273 RepID=A0A1R4ITJ7_9MICC|nr:hypothetical protein FM125_04515 [Micrococcus lylae]